MYSQNDGRSLTARTIDYLKAGDAQSREEIATDQTVLKTLLQKYPAQPRKEIALDRISAQTEKADWTSAKQRPLRRSKEVDGLVRQSPGMGTLCDQMPAQPHKNGCAKSCVFLLEAASLTEIFFFGMLSRNTERYDQTSLELNLNVEQLHKIKDQIFPRNNRILILWPRPGKAKS